jgi:hypothetical protein
MTWYAFCPYFLIGGSTTDINTNEQALRREAIRRRLEGQRRTAICQALDRSLRWFDKWWAEYRQNPRTDFASRSRAPHRSPQQMPASVVQAVVTMRQLLEQAATPQTRYGLIGARAIWARLKQLHLSPLPSEPTIQRILAQHQLTHPLGAGSSTAYYPWPEAWDVNAILATDIITKHVRGGAEIQNFHTIDHYSHAVCMTQHLNKTSRTSCDHLLHSWATLGLPSLHQFDNESVFCGGYTHPHVLGQVVRLCLFCGIEPLFTPYYEPKRNYQIESFHSLWVSGFWSRHEFANLDEVKAEVALFRHWYTYHYYPPALAGQTPAQVRRGARTAAERSLAPTDPTGALAAHGRTAAFPAQGRPERCNRSAQRGLATRPQVERRLYSRDDQHGRADNWLLASGQRRGQLATAQSAPICHQGEGSCATA